MKQVLLTQGTIAVEDVPVPSQEAGSILVRVSHSCISTGTELSGMKQGALPLWKKALKHPEKVGQVIKMLATSGYSKTKSAIQGKLSSGTAMGYSAAGVDLETGDRVACAGAQCAHHAEIIRVPKNLAIPIPKGLDFSEASTVALGAIALQGVRRANPTLGETFAVIGLGFLGQLTCQILQANGCPVFGIDVDPHRTALAERFGASQLSPENIHRMTGGVGVDGVIITAATPSSEVISTAFKLCRKKGRVVLVGDVGLNLKRADFYQKEIDFLISSSYGPGRYDPRYEEKGLDYPIGYVRWTEGRNMAEYLRLLAEKKIEISPLIHSIFPVEKASEAYETLSKAEPRPLLVLLSYPQNSPLTRVISNPQVKPASYKQIRLAVVGAGGFAKGMHLPNIQNIRDFHLTAIISRSGHNATATAKQFQARYAGTELREIWNEVDAVLIATRHNLHASLVLECLKAGKHVLVEKPLALTPDELLRIQQFYSESPDGPVLLTGFNRRFSNYAKEIHRIVQKRTNPMILNYRLNGGYIPLDHWVHGEEGGGRNLGEACHIYDLFTYLTGSEVASIHAKAIKPSTGYYSASDNFIATLSFKDGSIATLTYTALGSSEHPKEQMEVFVDGQVIALNDYRQLSHPPLSSKISEKGQKEELIAFANAILQGGPWPIPLWQQVQATEIAFEVENRLKT